MPTLKINTNETTITHDSSGGLCVKISSHENNGLSIEDGKIKVTKGKDGNPGTGGTTNLPGNGVAGKYNVGIGILRANNTVSRVAAGDPAEGNEGPLMTGPTGIVERIKKGTWS